MFRTTVVCLLLLPSLAFGQVKIEGPKEGTVGYRTKAKLTLDVDDPKIVCFPANDDWMAIQDFAGNKYIDFVPGRKFLGGEGTKLVTFVVAGNKAGKTYLETWEVVIKPDEDVVPLPKPKPIPEPDSELYKTLRAVYMVNPNAESKTRLISVYKAFQDGLGSYSSNDMAWKALMNITDSKMKSHDELRTTRDAVAEHFKKEIGQIPTAWDKSKTNKAVSDVIAVLEAIK